MIKLFEKILCKHDWKTHAKKVYNWDETKFVEGTENWYKPRYQKFEVSETVEILICKKCGKVHKVIY
jgi:hypothetical protein